MNILTKDINDISFDDVTQFCEQKVLEGVQLDYKQKTPKDLAKHFATFSNTQGGLIIIGIGENSKGLPTTYDGVPNEAKLVDQIHQFAANVTPLPTYSARTTDEQNGNVFVLVHIDEGAAAPYTTLNDPTVWIRTGNISTPASRDELLRLANKRQAAEQARNTNLEFAQSDYVGFVSEAETERKNLVKSEKPDVYAHVLGGEHCATLTIALQPYFPKDNLVSPQMLFDKQHEYLGNEYSETIFNRVPIVSIPGGLSAFSWNEKTGNLRNDQQFANGLCYTASDVLEHNNVTGLIKMLVVGAKLYSQLLLVRNYYKVVGYSGLVEGVIKLEGGVGAAVKPIGSVRQPLFMPDPGKVRRSSYTWELHLDSNILSDTVSLGEFFGRTMRDISWGLGIYDLPDTILKEYLSANGWS